MCATIVECRQHKRYRLENSISISSHGNFQVLDISRGGFRFKCPPHTTIPEVWETDILTPTISLEGLSVKRAWVSMGENGSQEYLPTVVGVKFGELTAQQNALLSQFIESISQDDRPGL